MKEPKPKKDETPPDPPKPDQPPKKPTPRTVTLKRRLR